MDPDLVVAKLESLARCVARIEGRAVSSPEALAVDLDSQDIVALNLERAVQISVDIGSHVLLDYDTPSPESMGAVFSSLAAAGVLDAALAERMTKAVGFRNIAVHEYQTIDWNIVYSIITTKLGEFRLFAAAILALIANQGSGTDC